MNPFINPFMPVCCSVHAGLLTDMFDFNFPFMSVS